jgi:hypothetical protein
MRAARLAAARWGLGGRRAHGKFPTLKDFRTGRQAAGHRRSARSGVPSRRHARRYGRDVTASHARAQKATA